jgi:hypothetical protein
LLSVDESTWGTWRMRPVGPETVLANPEVRSVIDMTQPTAIILAAVLHFRPAGPAAALCAEYMSRAARGS